MRTRRMGSCQPKTTWQAEEKTPKNWSGTAFLSFKENFGLSPAQSQIRKKCIESGRERAFQNTSEKT